MDVLYAQRDKIVKLGMKAPRGASVANAYAGIVDSAEYTADQRRMIADWFRGLTNTMTSRSNLKDIAKEVNVPVSGSKEAIVKQRLLQTGL